MFKIYNESINTSGNYTTLNRLSKILKLPITNKIEDNIIGIHAYKFGKKVINKSINFILIIGGTDINIDINNSEKKKIIIKAINQAKYVICFNNYIFEKVKNLNQGNNGNLKIIPQSVEYVKPSNFNLIKFLTERYNIGNINKIFLLVGNIRDVKDPFYLKSLENYFIENDIYIIYIGKIIEGRYEFKMPFININNLDKKDVFSCYQQSDGLINCSISEGMSSSILEAMLYHCPVYARKNEGNLSIVQDGFNGYIFNSPYELKKIISKNVNKLKKNANDYVYKNHNLEKEKYFYEEIL